MKKYNIIYADPPWQYNESWGNGAAKHHYETMRFIDIKALPIQNICEDNCHLYLWVTNPFLQEGLELCKAWGFEYKTLLTWVKTNKDNSRRMGLGYYFRGVTEHIIFGVKGKLPRLDKSVLNIFDAQFQRHSTKPQFARDLIIRTSGDLPRVELFARQKAIGWDSWGNEVESDINLQNYILKDKSEEK